MLSIAIQGLQMQKTTRTAKPQTPPVGVPRRDP